MDGISNADLKSTSCAVTLFLAAPLCLDLVLLSDLAARAGRYGIQRFLSFFLKSPMHDYTENEVPVNHLFQQYVMLKKCYSRNGGIRS